MSPSNRPTRFLLLANGAFDTMPLLAAITAGEHAAAEVEEVHSPERIRELVQRNPGQFAAAFACYSSELDADGRVLACAEPLTSLLPMVFVVPETDFVAMHRLGRAAKSGLLTAAHVTTDDVRRSLAYAVGAFEQIHDDVSARKTALEASREKEKLATSHATLERWAAELEIANARLREVDDLKTKFLSEVSHEIRTPLAAVVSAAKIIMKHHRAKPDVVDRFGNTILVEGERLTRLLNEFLDLTKIEAGCVNWHDAHVAAAPLVDDAITGIAAVADEKGIALHADVAPGLPSLNADRDRLIQVLSNLLMNALKYTPREGRVLVRATSTDGELRFEVIDGGPGIPESDLTRVFDRFHQVRRNDDRDNGRKGTGLGLCICREIVEHYGGRIWVESELGRGSTFVFTLPLTTTAIREKVPTPEYRRSSNHVRVLLLMEDEDVALRIASCRGGKEIDWTICTTPHEAIDVLATRRADVVIASRSLVDSLDDEFLSQIQSYGVAHVLLLSDEHGLVEAGVLENSDAVARSLTAIVAQGARVMVVEDDDNYRGLLEFQLAEEGYEVVAFDNGRDALDALPNAAPDIVLLDLIMPGLDGLTVLRRIRAAEPRLPVVVLTAMDDPTVAVAARELGAVGVFRKDSGDAAPYRTVVTRVRRLILEALDSPEMLVALG
jgi:signal transduction histidine kinase/CheY-like chemotaxis protein